MLQQNSNMLILSKLVSVTELTQEIEVSSDKNPFPHLEQVKFKLNTIYDLHLTPDNR